MNRHLHLVPPPRTSEATPAGTPTRPNGVPAASPCAVKWCQRPRVSRNTGLCEAHHVRFMDCVMRHTDTIGRGELA